MTGSDAPPPPVLWYDLAILHAARAGGSLHVAGGVAVAAGWVARADPALTLDLSAGRGAVGEDP
ncbi:MAG TPA: hypothetical protein VFL91_00485, partial [Thermomicrobiales bacterium]|nr:hypothetical protein [Thermomicrobiales bacterium]